MTVESRIDALRDRIQAKRDNAHAAFQTLKLRTLAEQEMPAGIEYGGAPLTPLAAMPKGRER